MTRVSVVGLGKLGTPLAACFASRGFTTIGVDVDRARVEALLAGHALFPEPGLRDALASCGGRLTATVDCARAVEQSDITFVVVPTPTDERAGFCDREVVAAFRAIGDALAAKDGYHLVVLVSTVMPGTIASRLVPVLEAHSGKTCGVDLGLCYSPEFIALGSVLRDLVHPDFVLIGESDLRSGEVLANVYHTFCENDPPVVRMNFANAELTKLAINAYVTMKISFANMLARLCGRLPGGDVDVVTAAVGMDSRIGSKYLKGAASFGGPCFPRDNVALGALSRSVEVPDLIPASTDAFNRQQVQWLAEVVADRRAGGQVGILGLAYKPNADVVEESTGLRLAETLLDGGIPVCAYDPVAVPRAQDALGRFTPATGEALVTFAASALACIHEADVVVITTPWDEFRLLRAADFSREGRPRTVIDCWRLLSHLRGSADLAYVAVGVDPL